MAHAPRDPAAEDGRGGLPTVGALVSGTALLLFSLPYLFAIGGGGPLPTWVILATVAGALLTALGVVLSFRTASAKAGPGPVLSGADPSPVRP